MFQPMGFPKPRVCSLGEIVRRHSAAPDGPETGPHACQRLHGPTGIRPLILNDQDQADVVAFPEASLTG